MVQTADAASNNWTLYPKPVPDWTIYVPPPVDAGVDAAPPKKPAPLADGVGVRHERRSARARSARTPARARRAPSACDESVVPTTCQDGYVCKAAVCVQDLGGDAAQTPPRPRAADLDHVRLQPGRRAR